jgi:hypothetical protein
MACAASQVPLRRLGPFVKDSSTRSGCKVARDDERQGSQAIMYKPFFNCAASGRLSKIRPHAAGVKWPEERMQLKRCT